jgi:putative DNA primase/helicase
MCSSERPRQRQALKYDEIAPWDEPVDGEQLLTEIATAIGCYVVMDSHQRDAAALWVVFAHAHDLFVYAPLLLITSPVKRCGKTRLQETLARLTPRPQSMSGISAAALARVIERETDRRCSSTNSTPSPKATAKWARAYAAN